MLELVIGKPAGIIAFTWLATRDRHRPARRNRLHDVMSLFITGLALSGDQANAAKLGILSGSLIAGLIGCTIIRLTAGQVTDGGPLMAPLAGPGNARDLGKTGEAGSSPRSPQTRNAGSRMRIPSHHRAPAPILRETARTPHPAASSHV